MASQITALVAGSLQDTVSSCVAGMEGGVWPWATPLADSLSSLQPDAAPARGGQGVRKEPRPQGCTEATRVAQPTTGLDFKARGGPPQASRMGSEEAGCGTGGPGLLNSHPGQDPIPVLPSRQDPSGPLSHPAGVQVG